MWGLKRNLTSSIRRSPFHCQACRVLGNYFREIRQEPPQIVEKKRLKGWRQLCRMRYSQYTNQYIVSILERRASFPFCLWTVAEDTIQTGCHSKCSWTLSTIHRPSLQLQSCISNHTLDNSTSKFNRHLRQHILKLDSWSSHPKSLSAGGEKACQAWDGWVRVTIFCGGWGGWKWPTEPLPMSGVGSWDEGEDRTHSQTSFPGCYVLPTASFEGANWGHRMHFPFFLDDINGTTTIKATVTTASCYFWEKLNRLMWIGAHVFLEI